MTLIGEFLIEDLPKMTNQIGRAHWAFKHRERVKWQRLISHQCELHGLKALGLKSAVLTFTRHSSKEPDFDGLVSGFKVITDSLVKEQVIVDDKPSVIGQSKFFWVYRPNKMGGRITVRVEA